MKIVGKGEYKDVIRRYFQSSFPKVAAVKGKDLLEILTHALVGSKELRYGPLPSPESLVTIRKTIARAIELNAPIPVLVPWGGRKMDKNLSLDVAEVSALRQLLHVDECVRKVYPQGLLIRVRIEDINARWLYKEDEGIEDYSINLQRLIEMLKGETKIVGVKESEMMDLDKYLSLAEEYSELLDNVIIKQLAFPDLDVNEVPAYAELESRGWKGVIPKEQRDYYLDRYRKMYPGLGEDAYVAKLADYFAGSKVRYDLNGRGNPDTEVGSFIQINFSHPVPGAPEGIFSNTLYYRTIPASQAKTHIAPWRAKGYLEVIGDIVTPKLVYPGKVHDLGDIHKNSTDLVSDTNEEDIIVIKTDFTYRDSLFAAMPYLGVGMIM